MNFRVNFKWLPALASCRIWALTFVTRSERVATEQYSNFVERFSEIGVQDECS